MTSAQYRAIVAHAARTVGWGSQELDDCAQEAALAAIQGRDWSWGVTDHLRFMYRGNGHTRAGGKVVSFVSGNKTIAKKNDTNGTEHITLFDTVADPNVDIEDHVTRLRLPEILARLTPRQRVIAVMLANDVPAYVVAERLGVSEGRVSQIVAEIRGRLDGVVPNKKPAVPRSERRGYVLRRLDEGATVQEIADELTITADGVRNHASRAGVSLRDGRRRAEAA